MTRKRLPLAVNSERIKAGLEIAMLVKRLTGLTYPTFVDNAESINTNFTRPDGQMIFAFVRRCDYCS